MKILIITPTYNEAHNLTTLIPDILSYEKVDRLLEVLVVDDASPDGSADVVSTLAETDPRIHLIRRSGKLGLGTAYVEGFRFAQERDFDVIVQMDADLSHQPRYLPEFFDKMLEFDLVVGSRYLNGVSIVNWPFWRLVISYLGCSLARRMTRAPFTDPTSGYKCFRTEVLRDADLDHIRSNGYGFQIEFTHRIWTKGYRVGEIPIVFIDRFEGQSKMSIAIAIETFFLITRLWCFRAWNSIQRNGGRRELRQREQQKAPGYPRSDHA
ncbi:MAG: polyprenol monophosphomannose synthase [Terriglobales bacterium]|jgi:dolichol-phosphate mannosyltransferase